MTVELGLICPNAVAARCQSAVTEVPSEGSTTSTSGTVPGDAFVDAGGRPDVVFADAGPAAESADAAAAGVVENSVPN